MTENESWLNIRTPGMMRMPMAARVSIPRRLERCDPLQRTWQRVGKAVGR